MKKKELEKMFYDENCNEIAFEGFCKDCGCEMSVLATLIDEHEIKIEGGAVYKANGELYIKCDACFENEPKLTNFQPCSVYSRVVGYLRPTNDWNVGKQTEFSLRKEYKIPEMV